MTSATPHPFTEPENPVAQAVAFTEFGGPEVLRMLALARPVAGDGEVVVRVHAATVNPTDLMMRSGRTSVLVRHN